ARPVRRGGVGVLGQPRPGPLPDKGHRWSRELHRVGTRNANRPKEDNSQPRRRDVTTGKRSAVISRMLRLGRGRRKRAVRTVPRRWPTSLGGRLVEKGHYDTSPSAYPARDEKVPGGRSTWCTPRVRPRPLRSFETKTSSLHRSRTERTTEAGSAGSHGRYSVGTQLQVVVPEATCIFAHRYSCTADPPLSLRAC
ncbi:MAG: hypothetical protein AVDCRST_MAG93-1206, partial [uncultured Chloroflexia bacterium]